MICPNSELVLLVDPKVLGLVWLKTFEASPRSWNRYRPSFPSQSALLGEIVEILSFVAVISGED